MKTISYFLRITMLSVILFSCKKDDTVTTATTPTPAQTTLLSKAIYSAVGTYDYTYDAQNRMKTETYSGNASNPATFTTFTGYDSDGKLTSFNVHYTAGVYTDYNVLISYNSSGRTDKQFIYNVSGPLLYYTTYTYAGSLVTVKQYNTAGTVTSTTEHTYGADGKNVVQSKSYNGSGTLTSTTVYSNFDSKKTIDGLTPLGYTTLPPSENNWQSYTRTNNSTGAVTNINTTFQYNADGYPVYRTADNGSTIEYQYIKK